MLEVRIVQLIISLFSGEFKHTRNQISLTMPVENVAAALACSGPLVPRHRHHFVQIHS